MEKKKTYDGALDKSKVPVSSIISSKSGITGISERKEPDE